jgi:hypothetical protein
MSIKYVAHTEEFAQRYYLKSFRKRYSKAFDIPWSAFELMLSKFDLFLERADTHVISDPAKGIRICKVGFKILPKESVKSSGNRCIVVHDKDKREIKILLVYCKNDIQGKNETIWWKQIIKKNYPKYSELL